MTLAERAEIAESVESGYRRLACAIVNDAAKRAPSCPGERAWLSATEPPAGGFGFRALMGWLGYESATVPAGLL